MHRVALSGETLNDRFRVEAQIEDRRYCALYKALDQQHNNRLVLLKQAWDVSPEAAERYADEAQRVIQHQGLPERYDYFQRGNAAGYSGEGYGYFSALSWMGDRTLQEVLNHQETGHLAADRAVRYMAQVCSALEVLHAGAPPIIHKHISPETIVVRQGGQAALRDYGLAYVANAHLHFDSRSALENDLFAAPEQFGVRDSADARTDVYRVGATLYYLVTGRYPVGARARQHGTRQERADGRAETVAGHAAAPQPGGNGAVSRELANVIEKAMALDANARYQTVADLRAALPNWQQLSTQHTTTGGGEWIIYLMVLLIGAGAFFFLRDDNAATTEAPPVAAIASGDINEPAPATLPPPATPVPPTPTPDIAATLAYVDTILTPVPGPQTALLTVTKPYQQPFRPGEGAILDTGVQQADIDLRATFVNPAAAPWDYGFAFRHDSTSHFRFIVGSDGSWYLRHLNEASGAENYVATSQSANLHLGPGERNELRILALGDTAYIFINNYLEGVATLSLKPEPGRAFVAIGMHPNLSGTWTVAVEAIQVSTLGQ